MGFFDRFSKDGGLQRHSKKVLNKHAQSADRFAALEKLRELGSDEAIYAMTRRFSYAYDKTIEDEQEKEWVERTLVDLGPRAMGPLRRYIQQAQSLSYPLRVLEKIATTEQVLEVIDEILATEEPGYTRDPAKKLQVLSFLSEWGGADDALIAKRIVPYLADFDEGVRFSAIEALAHHPDEATAAAPLLDALVRPEEESRRIKVRAAEVLAAHAFVVTSHKDRVTPLLATTLPGFGMQHEKLIRKKEK